MREALLNAFTIEEWALFGWTFTALLIVGVILTVIERRRR